MDIDREFERIEKRVERALAAGEKEIAKEYSKLLKELRAELGEYYSKYEEDGKLKYETMAKYDRAEKMQEKFGKATRAALVPVAALIRKKLREGAKESFYGTKDAVGKAAGRKLRGELPTDKIDEILQTPHSGLKLNDRLARRRAGVVDQIQETLGQGMQRGETYKQMADRLKNELEGDVKKANRIIRTEGHRVQEGARYQALERAKNQGVVQKKWWETMEDADVRDEHEHMGQEYSKENAIPLDEDFVNEHTGGRGPHPGKLGVPKDDINCRCATRIVIVDLQ